MPKWKKHEKLSWARRNYVISNLFKNEKILMSRQIQFFSLASNNTLRSKAGFVKLE